MSASAGQRSGFSLVEVMVALVILTFGLLAMASSTGMFFTQIRVADVNIERAAATEQAIEMLRAQPFTSITSVAEGYGETLGGYTVWWTVSPSGSQLLRVKVYTRGRDYSGADGWTSSVVDSFEVSLARGLQ